MTDPPTIHLKEIGSRFDNPPLSLRSDRGEESKVILSKEDERLLEVDDEGTALLSDQSTLTDLAM